MYFKLLNLTLLVCIYMLRNHVSNDIEHFKPSTYRPGLCNSEFTGFISTNLILIISLIKLKIPFLKNGF